MEENDIKEGTFVGISYINAADVHRNLTEISGKFDEFNKAIASSLDQGKQIINSLLQSTNDLADALRKLFDDITTQRKEELPRVQLQVQQPQPQQSSIDLTTESIEKIIKETEDALKKLSELK